MKKSQKIFGTALAFVLAFAFLSCNNNDEKKEEKKPEEKPAAVNPNATPFKMMMVQHHVSDYAKWYTGYMAHDSMRLAYGINRFALGREMEDSNKVIVFTKIADEQKAKDFAASPGLKEAMKASGVTGAPVISYVNVLRFDSASPNQNDRLMVKHHVKDFNAWLKVFDQEGRATRAGYGLQDRALSRDLDDSNLVYVTFVITDMAKAKARGNSPELKKLMTDAGVDGPPTMLFYRKVD
jgi:quinol monooxygenase YgiN